jgi:serine/threonine-protein kinase
MGDVFKARDPRLGRFVALKFLRRDTPEIVHRFLREARVQARIDHDNVCQVYEVGEVQGHPYIAMQYIAGGSLKEISDLLSITEKVTIMVDVADALHAAHQAGLIHRDIKPANILVERDHEGSWRPYVVDRLPATSRAATSRSRARCSARPPSPRPSRSAVTSAISTGEPTSTASAPRCTGS